MFVSFLEVCLKDRKSAKFEMIIITHLYTR